MTRPAPPLLAAPLCALLLAGCATGDRALESPHQPVVSGNSAFVPDCPNWNNTIGGEHESQSSNFGCATNTNLAAMVADPADLLHGRGDGLSSADVAVKAIKTWREAPATSKQWVVAGSVERTTGAPR